MRAIRIPGPEQVELVNIEIPAPERDEILVEVVACGLCTTDFDIASGSFWGEYPVIPGHEIVGIVRQSGRSVDSPKIGDRVALDPNIPCGRCRQCRRGTIHLCEGLQALGVTRTGGFAEYSTTPARNAYVLPDALGWEKAVMAEPLACVLHGLDRASPKDDDMVVVYGAGFIGLLFAAVLSHRGIANLLLVEPDSIRRTAARAHGYWCAEPRSVEVELGVARPSVCIVTTSHPSAVEEAVRIAEAGGRIVIFGVATPAERVKLSPYQVFKRELTIAGSFINPYTMARALALLPPLDVEWLVSDCMPLSDAKEALLRADSSPGEYKRVIRLAD